MGFVEGAEFACHNDGDGGCSNSRELEPELEIVRVLVEITTVGFGHAPGATVHREIDEPVWVGFVGGDGGVEFNVMVLGVVVERAETEGKLIGWEDCVPGIEEADDGFAGVKMGIGTEFGNKGAVVGTGDELLETLHTGEMVGTLAVEVGVLSAENGEAGGKESGVAIGEQTWSVGLRGGFCVVRLALIPELATDMGAVDTVATVVLASVAGGKGSAARGALTNGLGVRNVVIGIGTGELAEVGWGLVVEEVDSVAENAEPGYEAAGVSAPEIIEVLEIATAEIENVLLGLRRD